MSLFDEFLLLEMLFGDGTIAFVGNNKFIELGLTNYSFPLIHNSVEKA